MEQHYHLHNAHHRSLPGGGGEPSYRCPGLRWPQQPKPQAAHSCCVRPVACTGWVSRDGPFDFKVGGKCHGHWSQGPPRLWPPPCHQQPPGPPERAAPALLKHQGQRVAWLSYRLESPAPPCPHWVTKLLTFRSLDFLVHKVGIIMPGSHSVKHPPNTCNFPPPVFF